LSEGFGDCYGLSDNAIKKMLYRLEQYREEFGDDFQFEIR